MNNLKLITVIASSFFFLTSCADLTQCGMTKLDDATLAPLPCKTIKGKKVVQNGHVFTIRGFLGIWSRGMNTVSYRAEQELNLPSVSVGGVETSRLARFMIEKYQENKIHQPIILVGHSLGADEVIDVSWDLYEKNIPVQLLITTDPVMPRQIPPNVIHCYNVYKPHWTDFIPFYRGVQVTPVDASKTFVENVNLRQFSFDQESVTHFNIDQYIPVQDLILAQIRKELNHPVVMGQKPEIVTVGMKKDVTTVQKKSVTASKKQNARLASKEE